MNIIHTISDIRHAVAAHRQAGKRIAFVPTMGALHAGHVSLVEMARNHADIVVASIFVNPKQFGPNEDYGSYPRQEAEDCHKLADKQVDIAYLPNATEMFPEGFSTHISVKGVSAGLCGASRPGFFDGVALVVTKLLLQIMPDVVILGEKDYQQLMVINRLVEDLNIPVEVLGAAIVREQDGLAMSSRNVYLNAEERRVAPGLYRMLNQMVEKLHNAPGSVAEVCEWGKQSLTAQGFRMDYLELRDAATLAPMEVLNAPARLFVAAFLGKCRLIDNVRV